MPLSFYIVLMIKNIKSPSRGFEPRTLRLKALCSNQLSYDGIKDIKGVFLCAHQELFEEVPNLLRSSGIEPESQPWKSRILPLNYERRDAFVTEHQLFTNTGDRTRAKALKGLYPNRWTISVLQGVGFEPTRTFDVQGILSPSP